jgi:UDPglucose 6-dehydrogenase
LNISVIGTGYLGLIVGTSFAEFGNSVTCVDIDRDKIENLRNRVIPFYEPGLEKIVKRNISKGLLKFSTDTLLSVKNSDAVFITVGTPQKSDGNIDLSLFENATDKVIKGINGFTLIITSSTVPVGTTDLLQEKMNRESSQTAIAVSNPIFVKKGSAISDFMKPEKIIIGSESLRAKTIMSKLYAPFVKTPDKLVFMDRKSAELTKYASNALLSTKISFMNEIAGICDRVGADIESIRKGIGRDSRIGSKFLYSGIGYGGNSFNKDNNALIYLANTVNAPISIIISTQKVNRQQKTILIDKMEDKMGSLKGKSVAILGLAFKPDTDSTTESPAHEIVDLLLKKESSVQAYDPMAMDNFAMVHPPVDGKLTYCNNIYSAVKGCDAAVLCTEWHELQRPDFTRVKNLMKDCYLFDGRNVWPRKTIKENGFNLYSIGRPIIGEEK